MSGKSKSKTVAAKTPAPRDPEPGLSLTVPVTDATETPTDRRTTATLPVCPNCKDVVCVATKTEAFFTRARCPNLCGYTTKVARPKMSERLAALRESEPAVKRPS